MREIHILVTDNNLHGSHLQSQEVWLSTFCTLLCSSYWKSVTNNNNNNNIIIIIIIIIIITVRQI